MRHLRCSSSNTAPEVHYRHFTHLQRLEADMSTEALQSLFIIPRTPSPLRSPTPPCESSPIPLKERPFESLNMEEVQELCKRQQVHLTKVFWCHAFFI